MAVTVATLQPTQRGVHRASVIATADADTTATVPHGFGVTPRKVTITPVLQAPAGLSLWAATTINATNVVLTKSTAVGSGNAGVQVHVTAEQ